MYEWIELKTSADLAQLDTLLSAEYNPKKVVAKLIAGISDAVKGVLVERLYVDKDYRSVYYNFYSKKGLKYRPDCVRLHFFDSTVRYDDKLLKLLSTADERLNDHYFGYMILRPTYVGTIGRSVVSPDVRKGAKGFIVCANHKVHLLGNKLIVEGFPSMDQHSDISVCAHVACWSILRHYSERYSIHQEYLTHDITLMAQQFNPGGLVPSLGLNILHAERIFQEAGNFPFVVPRQPGDASFERELCAYVESGFPLYAAMTGREHAIAVIGCEWKTPVTVPTPPAPAASVTAPLAAPAPAPTIRFAWDEVQSVVVCDDNHLPYLSIQKNGGTPYSVSDIDIFIVGLPEKVYYPAHAVDRLAPTLYGLSNLVKLPAQDKTIVRYFITTSSGLRSFVRKKESEFDPNLLAAIMKLPLTQFVWVVEYATENQWAVGQVEARAIVDATAYLRDSIPLWLFHNRESALIFNRQDGGDPVTRMGLLQLADMGHSGFSRMVQNLRPTRSK